MQKILIGSKAIKHWYNDFNRPVKDTDYATATEVENKGNLDVEYLYNPVLFKYFSNFEILPPNALYTLKVSHLFWEKGFEKHLQDAVFLKDKGCELDLDLFRELREFWDTYLPIIRRSVLKMSKKEFFTNSVNESTDSHDILHEKVSEVIGLKPAFLKILKGEVEVCPKLFRALPFKEKVRVVQEEVFVMMLERLPKGFPVRLGFQKQLNNCIMKHFSEEVALFAIENYKIATIPPKYYLEFKNN